MNKLDEEDPKKLHGDATTLYDNKDYKRAAEAFLKAAELYEKAQNFFDASYSLFKAGECMFFLKKYAEAVEYFMKAAELAFSKGFDRFGVSALEYARDSYRELGEEEKVKELQLKIKEIKEKLSTSF